MSPGWDTNLNHNCQGQGTTKFHCLITCLKHLIFPSHFSSIEQITNCIKYVIILL